MPTFASSDKQVIQIRSPKERVAETLSSPDRIKELLADKLERAETLDARTLHLVRKPIEEKGVRFRGDYVVRYEYNGDGRVSWDTVGTSNMRSRGEARLTSLADGSTSVEYSESIECDMEVNRLLAAVLRPIVERKIKSGVSDHLNRLKASLER